MQKKQIIRLSKSFLGKEEKELVSRVLDEGYLGMGSYVQEFECAIKMYLSTQSEVICVNSGTSALHLAVQALGIGPGDEVLVPSITYVASFQAISATGATPVSCDIELSTGFIDLADAKNRLSKSTKAIMAVHYASNSYGMDEVYVFAREHSLRVIEDAAHSFACERNGLKVGSTGDVVCFSFDGIKNITSGEGGAVVTSDPEVIRQIKDARLLGVMNDTNARYSGQRSWSFEVERQGYRYHMSNIMAAIGLAQLRRLPEIVLKRMSQAKFYAERLCRIREVTLLNFSSEQLLVPHIFPILVPKSTREVIISEGRESGIEFGRHYFPNHLLAKFNRSETLPAAEEFYDRILTLPLHPSLTEQEQYKVLRLLKEKLAGESQ